MTHRPLHRTLGILLCLPLLCWGATGLVFYFKPGYADAYAQLAVKTYPLPADASLTPQPGWQDVRWLHTVLGQHLLGQLQGAPFHVNALTQQPFPPPTAEQLRALIDDAIDHHPVRYGRVAEVQDLSATTTTGVQITLNWQTLRLTQRGADTDLIDTLYNIHYLRWTGNRTLDQIVGLLGIGLLFALTGLGVQLYWRGRPGRKK